MGRFAMKSRGPGSDALGELTNEQRAALPPRFEAVGEAQASGADATDACRHLGGVLAGDGVSLDEALEGLTTHLDPGARSRPGVRRAGRPSPRRGARPPSATCTGSRATTR